MDSTATCIASAYDLRETLLLDREKALERIYARAYPMVLHYVKQRYGTDQDAKDVLQDAIILFYEKVVEGNLTLTAAVTTYLMGICKNLWRRELERRNRQSAFAPEEMNHPSEDGQETNLEQPTQTVMDYVEQLGEKCKNILVSFYYQGHKMEQISSENGYRNLHTATVQKFKCLERLRKAVASLSIDHFK